MILARFVGEDGISFFDKISESAARWSLIERYRAVDPDFTLTPSSSRLLDLQVDQYHRELWGVPIGPLACPIDDEDRVEVVYRFRNRQ